MQHSQKFIVFWVVFFCISCAVMHDIKQRLIANQTGDYQSLVVSKQGYASEPVISLHFRGESNIPLAVQKAVELALTDLDRVSCGMAKVTIIWNYNHDWDLPRAALHSDNIIRGVNVVDVENTLGRSRAFDLLGTTRTTENPRANPTWIFLVSDRLVENENLAEWTALHEICHAIGMKHVSKGLMEPFVPFFYELDDRPQWSTEDRNEFCRVYSCDPAVFKKCDSK